ncbi:class I SAM-dependent methyltransferase [Piscinibacter sakaiensis]|uniref:class I SAM-dependent methyltransferase n=1 Tax=Piscinibacter sakaiensis TaxID=1547922 RepID=UPI003AAE6890
MLWTRPTDSLEHRRRDLARRLHKLHQVFEVPSLQRERIGVSQVVAYYEHCHDAYRKYHSSEGSVHLALNDGDRFDPDGFHGQLRRMEQSWTQAAAAPRDVLELAFGQGFNLNYLAPRHPGIHFTGLDLTPVHAQITAERLQRNKLSNVSLTLGDFHHLPYADGSFDHVFTIESLCYATDLPRVLGEVARVLRPGGAFTIFDVYQPRPNPDTDADSLLAAELIARGMALERWQLLDELLAGADTVGLQPERRAVLNDQILPDLRRLERITGAIIRFPWLGRRALARRSPLRGRNILAGYLMRCVMQARILEYHHLLLHKPA